VSERGREKRGDVERRDGEEIVREDLKSDGDSRRGSGCTHNRNIDDTENKTKRERE
jgi:hypothetical protein